MVGGVLRVGKMDGGGWEGWKGRGDGGLGKE